MHIDVLNLSQSCHDMIIIHGHKIMSQAYSSQSGLVLLANLSLSEQSILLISFLAHGGVMATLAERMANEAKSGLNFGSTEFPRKNSPTHAKFSDHTHTRILA